MGLSYGEVSFNCTKNIAVCSSPVSVAKLEPLLIIINNFYSDFELCKIFYLIDLLER